MTETDACLLYSLCNGIGPKTFLKLLAYFKSAKNAWESLDQENFKNAKISENLYKKFDLFRKSFNLQDYLGKLSKAKVKVVGYTDKKYPSLLKELVSPPIVLYCKGDLGLLSSNQNIGVVGARKITSYGKDVTEKLVLTLASCKFTIVSGLAFGVDGIAQKTALENHGGTIAVLGCGVDCCTPAENQDLYEKILDSNGLIVSEYPLGMPPSIGTFPARNRIIAGLSLGVLITEAAEDSGSLITAHEAIKLQRPVFAVPGPITSHMSKGTLKLLKEGAKLVSSGEDIVESLQLKIQKSASIYRVGQLKSASQKFKGLNLKERKIVEMVESEAMSLDLLSKLANIPITKLMVMVSSLEMRGIIKNIGGEVSLKS